MADLTSERLAEIANLAITVGNIFGFDWPLEYDEDFGEVVCRFEDQESPFTDTYVEVFRTSQWIDGEKRSPLAEFLAASIKTVPVLLAEVERQRAQREPAPAVETTETYLIWSNNLATWWGPNGCHYVANVWQAGRYSEADAIAACRMRTWPKGNPPPEVMVLAPEHDRGPFTVDEIRAVPELMRQRVAEATREAVAERKAGGRS